MELCWNARVHTRHLYMPFSIRANPISIGISETWNSEITVTSWNHRFNWDGVLSQSSFNLNFRGLKLWNHSNLKSQIQIGSDILRMCRAQPYPKLPKSVENFQIGCVTNFKVRLSGFVTGPTARFRAKFGCAAQAYPVYWNGAGRGGKCGQLGGGLHVCGDLC